MSSKKDKKAGKSIPIESAEESIDSAQPTEGQPESQSPEVVEEPAAEPSLEQQYEQLKARYQRLGADYANYQKRSQRQIEQASQFAQESVVRAILPVLDNFDHTLVQGSEDMNPAAILQGVQIVYDHLTKTLSGFGMERVAVKVGTDFDPTIHEAVLHEESAELEPNQVVRELAAGYTMNERTIRPAKVSVAKAPSEPQTEEETTEE
ncbi:MAG: nucleotide exchange factor GrpE [Sedimentisphaerales bacterium]|nr:nucleotide exchange factor GrpE [Sedimentisphaerales bacterium]